MQSQLFGILAIVVYLAALAALLWSIARDSGTPRRHCVLASGWLAVGLHGLALYGVDRPVGLDFSFINALSLVTLIVALIVLLASWFRPADKLGVIVFPLAALILGVKLMVPEETHALNDPSWPMLLHVYASLFAFGFLNIAAIQALLLALQDWALHSHHPEGRLVRSLPSLQSMETMLFQLIGGGLLLLSLSLISGFLFLDDLFAQHLAHKTVLSVLAWFLFSTLLWGRQRHGWRGQTAIRWTLGGFFALMLAYFGSKMVLELILNRV